LNVIVISNVILSVTEISNVIVIFSFSERWTGFESESDVSWEIWNETEIVAGEGKGNENVSVAVIWTETSTLICLVGILAL